MHKNRITIREIFEAAHNISFIMTDLGGREARILEWSPGAENLFGYRREEMLGQHVARVHLPSDVARLPEMFAAMEQGRAGSSSEIHLVRRSGEQFPALFTAYPVCDEEGSIVAALGVSIDISERKRAEEALRRKSEELEAMFAASHVLTAVLDRKFRFLRVNRAYCVNVCKSPEELIGKGHFDLYPNEENERLFRQVLETGETSSVTAKPFDFPDQPDRGTTYWDWSVSPIKGEAGRVDGLVLTLVDATERERRRMEAERDFREANQELERRVLQRTEKLQEAVDELEAFSYSVSHDLAAPLRAINGFAHLLEEEYANRLEGAAHIYLNRITEATDRMDKLMLGLLQLSRLSRATIEPVEIDLAGMALKIIERLRTDHPDHDVTFTCPPQLPARGDSNLMRVVLTNLLANAWKFTSCTPQPAIVLDLGEREGEKVFFVRDNGAGFDMAYSEKLYGAFQRLHGTEEFPGTGIGLATVARIIRAHKGRIWAESEVGKGATFYFTLGDGERDGLISYLAQKHGN